ncbi:MAG: division/cell wall cluster transcriptional repressor MraZ [Clostridiales Family XIII bacterium]|jgi:MraZ protein|nr:division/cell wall cluster transcriptional repressor MraZ [Clostridiales Family XIII bacterium]
MLTGSYFNSIDSKGRAFIPTKLRYGLAERVWLVKGIDPCLYVFTPEGWADYTAEYITGHPLDNPDARKLKRFFLANSREVEIDGHGRINIPADYLAYAGVEKEVVFVGMGDMLELWGKERYDKESDPANIDPSELLRAVARAKRSAGPEGSDG